MPPSSPRCVLWLALTLGTLWPVAVTRGQTPIFEVASIRPTPAASTFRFSFLPGGQLLVSGVPAAVLIQRAYRLPAHRVVDMPEWAKSERFEIRAKAPESVHATTSQLLDMLAALLADRFQLRTHRETRELPVYLLEREGRDDPLGFRIEPSPLDCTDLIPGTTGTADRECTARMMTAESSADPFTLTVRGRTLDMLARDLQLFVDRPIVNATGVEGLWDVRLQFTPAQGFGSQTNGVSIFTAVREQLALKLTAAKAPVDVLVVETLSRPSPN